MGQIGWRKRADKICQGGPRLQSSGPCVLTPQCWTFNGWRKLLSPPLVSCLFLFYNQYFFFRNLHLLTGAAINYNWINYTLMIKKCWIQIMSDKNDHRHFFLLHLQPCLKAPQGYRKSGLQDLLDVWLDNLIYRRDANHERTKNLNLRVSPLIFFSKSFIQA